MSELLTHKELVEKGRLWLFRRFPLVLTEIVSGTENPDILGFSGGCSCMIEAKATRSDFLADKNKPFRHKSLMGVGDTRLYITNPGIIEPGELPEKWGLLEVRKGKVYRVVDAKFGGEKNSRQEQIILLSAIRRIGQLRPSGMSIKAYYYETLGRATLTLDVEAEHLIEITEIKKERGIE